MPAVSNKVIIAAAVALAAGVGIILVARTTLQNGSNNPLAALGADNKTIFLHQKPEANVMWNDTGESYFNMQHNVFHCDSTFDGSIYYQKNDTNYFKCIDDGSTRGENATYQIVP